MHKVNWQICYSVKRSSFQLTILSYGRNLPRKEVALSVRLCVKLVISDFFTHSALTEPFAVS